MSKAGLVKRRDYWRKRARLAEKRYDRLKEEAISRIKLLQQDIARLERRSVEDSHRLGNYEESYRRQRDREIGEMGGGG